MSDHERAIDLLPAYALGCLSEEEKSSVAGHLKTCNACQAELLTFQAVTDQLGFATPIVTPPAALKGKVMQNILSRSSQARSVVERKGWLAVLRSWSVPWSLASLAIILALVASNLLLWRQVNQLQKGANPTEFQTLALVGTDAAPSASGIIIISSDGNYGTLVVEQLPQLDAAHQYQLWLIKDGERTSGGVFSIGRVGYGSLYVRSPQPLASYTSFGITIEPAGGSPGPTGAKVLGTKG